MRSTADLQDLRPAPSQALLPPFLSVNSRPLMATEDVLSWLRGSQTLAPSLRVKRPNCRGKDTFSFSSLTTTHRRGSVPRPWNRPLEHHRSCSGLEEVVAIRPHVILRQILVGHEVRIVVEEEGEVVVGEVEHSPINRSTIVSLNRLEPCRFCNVLIKVNGGVPLSLQA